jgi:hypothetical protein
MLGKLGRIGRDPLRRSVSDFIGKGCTSHLSFKKLIRSSSITGVTIQTPLTCERIYLVS